MKQLLKDIVFTTSMFGPMIVGLALTYVIFGFVAWEMNPGKWNWNHRFVATVFGISFGTALSIRVSFRRGNL
jgi:hypothetical protein